MHTCLLVTVHKSWDFIDLWLYPLVTIIANLFISWTFFQSDVSEPAWEHEDSSKYTSRYITCKFTCSHAANQSDALYLSTYLFIAYPYVGLGHVEYTLHTANNSHNACGTLHKLPARTVCDCIYLWGWLLVLDVDLHGRQWPYIPLK